MKCDLNEMVGQFFSEMTLIKIKNIKYKIIKITETQVPSDAIRLIFGLHYTCVLSYLSNHLKSITTRLHNIHIALQKICHFHGGLRILFLI